MKRLWAAIALISFTGIICVSGMITLNKRTDELTGMLEQLCEATEKDLPYITVNLANEVQEKWQNYHTWYTVFFQDISINEVTKTINRIPSLAQENDMKRCKDECLDAIVMLRTIHESEKLTFGNIL